MMLQIRFVTFIAALLPAVLMSLPAFAAQNDELQHRLDAMSKQVEALEQEIQQLREAVAALEAIKPTITTIMPEFSERFHVMHRAGDSGDWAVAAHELLEMRRLIDLVKAVDAEKGAMITGFMNGVFEDLNAAIEHANGKSFEQALADTVDKCNACHVAVGSEFMKVALDIEELLSIRHSHQFKKSQVDRGHTHEH